MTRLLGEALVTSEGQRGFRRPATLDDFRDLTEVRKLIETEALRHAIAVGGETWESDIVAAFYRLSKTEERLRDDPVGGVGRIRGAQSRFPPCADRRVSLPLAPSP